MKKKLLNFMLVGAFASVLSLSFVACSSDDYDDDIKGLQGEIDKLKTELATLQAAVGTFVKSVSYNETTGELTVESTSGSSKINLGKDEPVKYTLAVSANGEITLTGNDGSSTSATIQFPEATKAFDPAKLTINANGEIFYDGIKTGVTIPASTEPFDPAKLTINASGEILYDGVKTGATIPAAAEAFDPTKLRTNANGEILYDGVKTGVTIPESTSASMVEIKENNVVIGYTIRIGNQSADFFINNAVPLKSLVFKPQTYLGGVKAMKARVVEYGIWTKFKDYNMTPDPDYPYGKVEWWNAPGTGTGYATSDVVAYYHLNPASVTKDQIKNLSFISDDEEYVSKTRAAGFAPVVTSYEVENGMLIVKIKFATEKIQAVDANLISVLALQVTTMNGDEIVTSDYAAVYKTVINDLTFSFNDKGVPHRPHLWGAYEDGRKDATNITLKGKAEDAIWDYVVAKERGADYTVLYKDDELDLKRKVEIHYNEWRDVARPFQPKDRIGDEHKILTADEIEAFGLALRFSMSDYWSGKNETPLGQFAEITSDGVLKAKVFDATGDPFAAINRMPVVRVELVDLATNNVMNVGWIKVKILDGGGTPGSGKSESWEKTFKYIQPTCDDINLLVTVKEMNVDIYNKVGMSKEVFHDSYTLGASVGDGVIDEKIDVDGSTHTTLLRWTLSPSTVWMDTDGNFRVTATYEPKNSLTHAPFTVTFATTVIKPHVSYNNKLTEYWHENMSYIEINPIVPQTMTNDCDIQANLDNVFIGNKPMFTAGYDPVYNVDKYENKSTSFDVEKVQGYKYYFDKTNVGRKVTGIDGQEYTLGVVNDINGIENVFLIATLGVMTQIVAYINPANGVVTYNNRHVLGADYRSGYKLPERPWLTPSNIVPAGLSIADTYAKALLNRDARNSGEEFWAWIGADVRYECRTLATEVFRSKFLRPVNVVGTTTKTFKDGVDSGSTIAMLEMVNLSDWRSITFTKANGYYNYYGVKTITIDKANITCNLNGGDLNTQLLTSVTDLIEIKPNYVKDPITPDYGTVTYKNNGFTVSAFKLRIPVDVEYIWGSVRVYVVVDVEKTI